MSPMAAAIIEAVHTTATRSFDVLEMSFPRDEFLCLRREVLEDEARRWTPPPLISPVGPMVVRIHTAFGEVVVREEA